MSKNSHYSCTCSNNFSEKIYFYKKKLQLQVRVLTALLIECQQLYQKIHDCIKKVDKLKNEHPKKIIIILYKELKIVFTWYSSNCLCKMRSALKARIVVIPSMVKFA